MKRSFEERPEPSTPQYQSHTVSAATLLRTICGALETGDLHLEDTQTGESHSLSNIVGTMVHLEHLLPIGEDYDEVEIRSDLKGPFHLKLSEYEKIVESVASDDRFVLDRLIRKTISGLRNALADDQDRDLHHTLDQTCYALAMISAMIDAGQIPEFPEDIEVEGDRIDYTAVADPDNRIYPVAFPLRWIATGYGVIWIPMHCARNEKSGDLALAMFEVTLGSLLTKQPNIVFYHLSSWLGAFERAHKFLFRNELVELR